MNPVEDISSGRVADQQPQAEEVSTDTSPQLKDLVTRQL